jgi:hypothetical protein
MDRTVGSADMAMLVVPADATLDGSDGSRPTVYRFDELQPAAFSTDSTAPPARIHRRIFQCHVSM